MSRTRSPDYESVRERIMDVAARLFAEGGHAGTSLGEISSACAISKPLLYHYFRDKRQLLLDILARDFAVVEGIVREIEHLRLPARERLQEFARRTAVALQQGATFAYRLATQGTGSLDAESRALVARERAVILAFLDDAIRELSPGSGGVLSTLMARIVLSIPLWGAEEDGAQAARAAGAAVEALLDGIDDRRPRAPARREPTIRPSSG